MRMIQKLKALEKAVVFLSWATDAEFVDIKYVGVEFIEFEILDMDSMEYTERVVINSQHYMEVMTSGFEISRVIAEICAKLKVSDVEVHI